MKGAAANSTTVELEFDRTVYSLEAVKRAAYEFMDRLHIALETDKSQIICVVRPTDGSSDIGEILSDFQREVLDQDLRISLEASTEPVRAAILGLAFSKTGLQDG